MTLRPATPADQDFILSVRNDPAARAASRNDLPRDSTWYHQRLDDPAHHCFVALDGGTPIGFGSLQAYTPSTAEISVALAPEHRGRGLSHDLIEALVAKGVEMGIERFLATVRGENVSSLRAFLHEGFLPTKWVYLERRK